ncbi:hypothetical protein [Flavobacterium sedimenticola]|uniref:Phage integrase SAM-like domain-containing protein n=1 Tax=Flavobacterium sedimenticola TaxID=3043286 RepID=A0ABT6XNR9_9FLAO|nr:hypothetical protein [Flavobacterium sedimenticola]MDI9256735.1 hypothetical protein [Flavobacterium sedimenticola]
MIDEAKSKKAAFAAADEAYQKEKQRTDHYMISGVVKKLFTAAVNGDIVSKERLVKVIHEFEAYYKTNPDSYAIYQQYRKLYDDYSWYLTKGGKALHYDLTVFRYFKTLKDSGKSYK